MTKEERKSSHSLTADGGVRLGNPVRNKVVPSSFYKEAVGMKKLNYTKPRNASLKLFLCCYSDNVQSVVGGNVIIFQNVL